MACDRERWMERIIDRWAGELSEEATVVLEQHLAECPDCSAEARRLESLAQAAAPRLETVVDPRMEARLAARLRGSDARPPARGLQAFWRQPLPAFAALPIVLIALAGGFGLGRVGTGAVEAPAGGAWPTAREARSSGELLHASVGFSSAPGDLVEIACLAVRDSL